MAARRNIFAYTPPGSYPPYFSVNREADGTVTVTVRSNPVLRTDDTGDCPPTLLRGHTATMTLPPEEWRKLIVALALEPGELWPGSEYSQPDKYDWTNSDTGKPHGGPVQ